LNALLLRNSLKMATAIFVTAALAEHFDRIQFVYYSLTGTLFAVDDNDDQTWKAGASRIMGTIVGGLITFWVHTIASGWGGVFLSLLFMIPVLRVLGWTSGLGTAVTICVMFLMIPTNTTLNWDYVFNRTMDTALGCAVGIGTNVLFWPKKHHTELQTLEASLQARLLNQIQGYRAWMTDQKPRPDPLSPVQFGEGLQRMQQLVTLEQTGPAAQQLNRRRWPQRLMLWQQVGLHWVQWERLVAASDLPTPMEINHPLRRGLEGMANLLVGQRAGAPATSSDWKELAQPSGSPLLLLLGLAEELKALQANLRSLGQGGVSKPCP
jgi:uncharacterized membrane protein YgaE (UPF0421/DUF939 family)